MEKHPAAVKVSREFVRHDRMPKLFCPLLRFISKKGKMTLSFALKCKSRIKNAAAVAANDDGDTERRAFVEERRRKRAAMHKRTRYEFELRSVGSSRSSDPPLQQQQALLYSTECFSFPNVIYRYMYFLGEYTDAILFHVLKLFENAPSVSQRVFDMCDDESRVLDVLHRVGKKRVKEGQSSFPVIRTGDV